MPAKLIGRRSLPNQSFQESYRAQSAAIIRFKCLIRSRPQNTALQKVTSRSIPTSPENGMESNYSAFLSSGPALKSA